MMLEEAPRGSCLMLKTNSEMFAQTRQTQTASSETRTDCPRPWRKVFQYIAGSGGGSLPEAPWLIGYRP